MNLFNRVSIKVILLILLSIAGIILVSFVYPIIRLCFRTGKSKDIVNRINIVWLTGFSRIVGIKVDIKGVPTEGTAIMVANHISWMDILALGPLFPADFVTKSEIINWPVIGYIARYGDAIFINRKQCRHVREVTEKMAWLLKQNRKIVAFPEGTTTQGDRVLPFHASILQPAILAKAPVQPILIQFRGAAQLQAPFVGDDEFVPHLLKIFKLKEVPVLVKFLPAISSTNKNRNQLSSLARTAIDNALMDEQGLAPVNENYHF